MVDDPGAAANLFGMVAGQLSGDHGKYVAGFGHAGASPSIGEIADSICRAVTRDSATSFYRLDAATPAVCPLRAICSRSVSSLAWRLSLICSHARPGRKFRCCSPVSAWRPLGAPLPRHCASGREHDLEFGAFHRILSRTCGGRPARWRADAGPAGRGLRAGRHPDRAAGCLHCLRLPAARYRPYGSISRPSGAGIQSAFSVRHRPLTPDRQIEILGCRSVTYWSQVKRLVSRVYQRRRKDA
jgi:hypothetical protein